MSELWDGTRKINKQFNYSHEPTQTKQQVGLMRNWTFLVHGQATNKHGLIRLAIAQT